MLVETVLHLGLHRVSTWVPNVNSRCVRAQICFVLDYTGSMETQVAQARKSIAEIIEAVRRIRIAGPDTFVDLEMTAIAYNDWDEHTAKLGRPVVAALGGREIAGEHSFSLTKSDFNLGGKFTKDVQEMETWLDQHLGHGGCVPKELTGALLAASYLEWTAEKRLVIVITDSPCHGKDYSKAADNQYCDPNSGLTCTGRPEVPLKTLKEKDVKVSILHTGSAEVLGMCQRLEEVDPELILSRAAPVETAEKLVSIIQEEMQLQPLCYILRPHVLEQKFNTVGLPLDSNLPPGHVVEVEEADRKERHNIGRLAACGFVFLSSEGKDSRWQVHDGLRLSQCHKAIPETVKSTLKTCTLKKPKAGPQHPIQTFPPTFTLVSKQKNNENIKPRKDPKIN